MPLPKSEMIEMLDRELITAFVHDFFGYGNLAAPIWFVGMEEGGGASETEVAARLAQWSADPQATIDIRTFGAHPDLSEHARWFEGETPPLQPTWSKLIRLQLARLDRPSMIDDVRRYQRDELGAADGLDCLLELLPLPSPGLDEWHYSAWSDLPWLATRDAYVDQLLDHRIDSLRALIETHSPAIVVFYGVGYLDHWEAVTGDAFPAPTGYALQLETAKTRYVVTPHPTAFGAKNMLFQRIGMTVR